MMPGPQYWCINIWLQCNKGWRYFVMNNVLIYISHVDFQKLHQYYICWHQNLKNCIKKHNNWIYLQQEIIKLLSYLHYRTSSKFLWTTAPCLSLLSLDGVKVSKGNIRNVTVTIQSSENQRLLTYNITPIKTANRLRLISWSLLQIHSILVFWASAWKPCIPQKLHFSSPSLSLLTEMWKFVWSLK